MFLIMLVICLHNPNLQSVCSSPPSTVQILLPLRLGGWDGVRGEAVGGGQARVCVRVRSEEE